MNQIFSGVIFDDYLEVQEEIKMLEKRIEQDDKELIALGNDWVKDSVSGGIGGTQHFTIEGYPQSKHDLIIAQMEKHKAILECRRNKLIEQENDVEEAITMLDTSRARRFATKRYIEGKSWKKIAKEEGAGHTDSECRMYFSRAVAKAENKMKPTKEQLLEALREHEYESGNV